MDDQSATPLRPPAPQRICARPPNTGRAENHRAASVARALRMGLSEHTIGRPPGKLSGGVLQRAALARALLARPEVLICDEITSGLDTVTQEGILDLLDELRDTAGLTLIVITHDTGVVARLADRVLLLHNGSVLGHRTPAELRTTAQHPVARALLGGEEKRR